VIVPDASTVALLFAAPGAEPRSPAAAEILRADPDWVVPEHWRTEVLSAVRGLHLGGRVDRERAVAAVGWLTRVTVAVAPTGPLMARMWQLHPNLSAYDAGYVAAAEAHDVTLVTADVRIARAGVARCPVRVVG
jgi:predicted nucleic acid-binding protein